MRVLQRMVREHLTPTNPENSAAASELLILSLDLVKNRVAVMGQDMRKAFIGQLLVGLIEKSPDVKVGCYLLNYCNLENVVKIYFQIFQLIVFVHSFPFF